MSVKREELVRDSLTLNLSRLYARVLELEERIESGREDLLEGYYEALREFRENFREFVRTRLRSFAEETMETGPFTSGYCSKYFSERALLRTAATP